MFGALLFCWNYCTTKQKKKRTTQKDRMCPMFMSISCKFLSPHDIQLSSFDWNLIHSDSEKLLDFIIEELWVTYLQKEFHTLYPEI